MAARGCTEGMCLDDGSQRAGRSLRMLIVDSLKQDRLVSLFTVVLVSLGNDMVVCVRRLILPCFSARMTCHQDVVCGSDSWALHSLWPGSAFTLVLVNLVLIWGSPRW